jgi:hypothetical protein
MEGPYCQDKPVIVDVPLDTKRLILPKWGICLSGCSNQRTTRTDSYRHGRCHGDLRPILVGVGIPERDRILRFGAAA